MEIVKKWTEFGHTFVIERLAEPRQQGATLRHYRLWDNDHPASGGQWHAEIESAIARAEYVLLCDYASRIRWLENRVSVMENRRAELLNAMRLVRSIIIDGALTGFNPLDGDWAERLFKSQAVTKAALDANV